MQRLQLPTSAHKHQMTMISWWILFQISSLRWDYLHFILIGYSKAINWLKKWGGKWKWGAIMFWSSLNFKTLRLSRMSNDLWLSLGMSPRLQLSETAITPSLSPKKYMRNNGRLGNWRINWHKIYQIIVYLMKLQI